MNDIKIPFTFSLPKYLSASSIKTGCIFSSDYIICSISGVADQPRL